MQNGNLFRHNGSWYLRYYVGKRRVKEKLGRCSDFKNKTEVRRRADEILQRLHLAGAGSSQTLVHYIQHWFLPVQRTSVRPSTYRGYECLFRTHIAPRPEARLELWRWSTADVQSLLVAIAKNAKHPITTTTLKHIKAFLSGVFRTAAISGRTGLKNNPVHEAQVFSFGLRPPTETVYYTLADIQRVLPLLPLQARAACAVAAFAGLRQGEVQGLDWEDYDGNLITVRRSVWKGKVSPPKTRASAAPVPVIPVLRDILEQYGASVPERTGRMFSLTLDYVARRAVARAFKMAGVQWRGWHAFRRGLASTLFELGADDLTAQRVLRHASVQVTREHYLKTKDAKLMAAMGSLNAAFENGPRLGHDQNEDALDSTRRDV